MNHGHRAVNDEQGVGMKTVAQLLNAKADQQVYTIAPDALVIDALRLMAEKNLGGLPVVENGELLGLLSIGDLVKAAIAEQAELIQQLEQYIRGE